MDSEHPSTCQTSANNGFGPAGTGDGTRPLPAGVLDSFLATASRSSPLMQLFLSVYQVLGSQLGPDPSLILTLLGVLWVIMKLAYQVYLAVDVFIEDYCMCTMYISSEDPIYKQVMKWLSKQKTVVEGSSITAETVRYGFGESDENFDGPLYFTDGGDKDSGHQYINFSRHASRSCPRFVLPMEGKITLWHEKNLFVVSRMKPLMSSARYMQPMGDSEYIKISCFGRSIQPAKALLGQASEMFHDDTKPKTLVFRPEFRDRASEPFVWRPIARRSVRPMSTVMLPKEMKETVLQDMNEFLHPETRNWYSSRGIPYRRGYLFHGPPGTGKTSISAAIAGVFGISLFTIDLLDSNMTDQHLLRMFNQLPRQCIVLLEDIDAVGTKRDGDSGGAKNKGISGNNKEDTQADDVKDAQGKEVEAKASCEDKRQQTRNPQRIADKTATGADNKPSLAENLSFSGLLNAIDGVASQEGRILVMTTNRPESLDEALLRPGRVDLQIGFRNATSQQASELFCRMYEDFSSTKPINKALPEKEAAKDSKDGKEMSPEEIKRLSEAFGEKIPDDLCSPAKIQGFLLLRRKNPRAAVDDVDSWVEEMVKQEESGSNVRKVQ